MNTDIKITSADASGYREIAEILREGLGYECTDELVRERLISLDPEREAVFIAAAGGVTVGVIHIEKYKLLYSELLANVPGIAVKSGYRRQGVGRALIKRAEEQAADWGAVSLRLNSGGERKEAHEFYRSMGFDSEKIQIRFMKKIQGEENAE